MLPLMLRAGARLGPCGPLTTCRLASSLAGLPPAVVLTAEHDSVRHDGLRYVGRLRSAGVPVVHDETPDVDHYFLSADLDRAPATMAMVAEQVRTRLG